LLGRRHAPRKIKRQIRKYQGPLKGTAGAKRHGAHRSSVSDRSFLTHECTMPITTTVTDGSMFVTATGTNGRLDNSVYGTTGGNGADPGEAGTLDATNLGTVTQSINNFSDGGVCHDHFHRRYRG
jgi:hypothetical protein